jgi:hypothetical protein
MAYEIASVEIALGEDAQEVRECAKEFVAHSMKTYGMKGHILTQASGPEKVGRIVWIAMHELMTSWGD